MNIQFPTLYVQLAVLQLLSYYYQGANNHQNCSAEIGFSVIFKMASYKETKSKDGGRNAERAGEAEGSREEEMVEARDVCPGWNLQVSEIIWSIDQKVTNCQALFKIYFTL